MGISTNYYTIHGVKVEWNDDFAATYDDVYDDDDTPHVLMDNMACEYIILGTKLYDSGDLRWGDCEDSFVEIDLDSLPDIEIDYKKAFIDKFPQFSHLMDAPFKLMTLVHYS